MISRPKNRDRETASEASVPSTRAMRVAPDAAFTESQRAPRTSGLFQATLNHFVV